MPRTNRSGFTLIEIMITIAVLAILAAIALPSFKSTLEKRRVVGAADNLFAALQYARSEAIKQNREIQFHFDTAAWCYGMDDTGANCDCAAEPANCTVTGQLKVETSDSYSGVVMNAQNFDGNDIIFSPRQGMPVDPDDGGEFTFSVDNYSKTVSLNAVGRVTMD